VDENGDYVRITKNDVLARKTDRIRDVCKELGVDMNNRLFVRVPDMFVCVDDASFSVFVSTDKVEIFHLREINDMKSPYSMLNLREECGEITVFKVNFETTRFRTVAEYYAKGKGVRMNSLRFLLDGENLANGRFMNMRMRDFLQDGDTVNILREQLGC